jgi:hypothetical protein
MKGKKPVIYLFILLTCMRPPPALPPIALPNNSSIAAFSVARAADPRQRVDTYVLYLDASSDINMLYTDSSTSGSPTWRNLQPAALRGVDRDTSIACLTMATSPGGLSRAAILLEQVLEDNTSCYFQKGGLVMEAKLSGRDWVIVGRVPMS